MRRPPILAAAVAALAALPLGAQTLRRDAILRAAAAADSATGGEVGVAVVHVERGERVAVRGGERFFMSSVMKLPLAVQLLDRVDRGERRLDDRVTLGPADMRTGRSPIADRHPGGATVTVRELLALAVADSDNSAADALVAYSGGPDSVTARLRALGIDGLAITRPYALLSFAYAGVTPPPRDRWTRAVIDSVTRAAPDSARDRGAASFVTAPENWATPDGAARLLARLQRGELLRPASRALLFRHLRVSRNPATRLVAGVPAGTPVAHKTGSWGGWRDVGAATNDVGLVTLPGGRGHLAVALFARGTRRPAAEVDAALAGLTRAIWAAATAAR